MKKLYWRFPIFCLLLTCGILAARSESARGSLLHRAASRSSSGPCLVASSRALFQCGGGGGGGCPPCYVYSYKGGSMRPASVCCDPSPILVDTSGTGFSLTSAANGVVFDISGTGHPIQMAWTALGADNAFLALPTADGLVHDGTQLFGNYTPQPPSANPNGFAALAVYDLPSNGGNGDGIIDARDKIFASLRLWIDANHDGISQSDELHALPSLGVNSINLAYKLSERRDQYGNLFRYRAPVNAGDQTPTGRMAYDVFFVSAGPAPQTLARSFRNPDEDTNRAIPASIKKSTLTIAGQS